MGAMGRRLYHWTLAALALLCAVLPAQAHAQRLLFQLSLPSDQPGLQAEVQVQEGDVYKRIPLRDDGAQEGDVAGDGIAVGWHEGPYLRHRGIRLFVEGEERYYALEKTEIDDTLRIGWTLSGSGRGVLRRSAAVRTGALPTSETGRPLIAAYGWGALALIYVLGVVFVARRRASQARP